jgi:hypothetical protein
MWKHEAREIARAGAVAKSDSCECLKANSVSSR